MATMYDRFARKDVPAAPEAVQAAHAKATAPKQSHVGDKRPVPPTVAKLQSMTVAVCGFNWQEFVAKYTESFQQERTQKSEEKEYYEREIIKEIGRKQFKESLGTSIIKTQNKHGEIVYVRSRGSKTREQKWSQKLEVQKTADVEEGDLEAAIMGIRDKFKASCEPKRPIEEADSSSTKRVKTTMKKPAAEKATAKKKPLKKTAPTTALETADFGGGSDASDGDDEEPDQDDDNEESEEEDKKKSPYEELHLSCRKIVAASHKKDTDAVIMKAKVAKDKGAKSAVEALNEALTAMHAEIKVVKLRNNRFHFYLFRALF